MSQPPSPAAEHAKTCDTCRNRSITEGGLCPTGWLLLAQETNADAEEKARAPGAVADDVLRDLAPQIVTSERVRRLSERTRVGFADCKRALEERHGVELLAESWLRCKGTMLQGREPLYMRWLELRVRQFVGTPTAPATPAPPPARSP